MKRLLLILLIIIPCALRAQLPDYYTYLVKGEVKYKKGNNKAAALKPKSFVFKDDLISLVNDNAEVTLVDKNTNYVVLSRKGNYKVKDLPSRMHKESEGISKKYFHFIWEELFRPGKQYYTFSRENLAGVPGGVVRGGCDVLKYPLNRVATAEEQIRFGWNHYGKSLNYQFILYDGYGNEKISMLLRDTQVVIKTKPLILSDSNRYFWTVMDEDRSCSDPPKFSLEILSVSRQQLLLNYILGSTTYQGDSALYFLDIAARLETKFLLEPAGEYYRKARDADPNDVILKKNYENFLKRNQMY